MSKLATWINPTDTFVDRETIDAARFANARFASLAAAITAYWQQGGKEVLPLSHGDSRLLEPSVTAKAIEAEKTLPKPDACVLLAISDEPNPRILLTVRASSLSSHAGEVAFVGGKVDDTDASSQAAALREAGEEVGLAASHATLIGYLPMQMSRAGLLVRPVVMGVDAAAMDDLVASPDEIASIFWLPLDDILQPPVDHAMDRRMGTKSFILRTPAWLGRDGQVVWGLTARILANLAEIAFGRQYPWYYRIDTV